MAMNRRQFDDDTLTELVRVLLEVNNVDDRTAEAAYQAGIIAQTDFDKGWRLLKAAFDGAVTDLQLQYIARLRKSSESTSRPTRASICSRVS